MHRTPAPTLWPRAIRALALCGAGLLCAGFAQAQVNRCTDPRTGKITYTNDACSAGQTSREIEARKTPEELARDRAQAQEALQRKQERQAAEAKAEREARQAQRDEQPPPRTVIDYANSAGCANARQQLTAAAKTSARTAEEQAARMDAAQRQMELSCLGPEGYAQAEAARANRPQVVVVQPPAYPMRPPRPHHPPSRPQNQGPYIKECSAFTCTDSNGKRYPRTGRGSFEDQNR